MAHITLLGLIFWLCLTAAKPIESDIFSDTTDYPLPNLGNVAAHDPSIIYHDDHYYMFKGGIRIPIFKASQLSGPWQKIGTVLEGESVVRKQNRSRPWAPTVTQWKGRFYCFYSISKNGRRNSAIGLASSDSIEPGSWTDHGALFNTGKGRLSGIYPYSVTNAIDPAFFVDPASGKPYLQYGSYWKGIFQIPLTDDLSIANPKKPNADHLAYVPNKKRKPIEGSFLSYKAPYYYTWFSHGQCCHFHIQGFPRKGDEYNIRVGRSTSVHGPFVDRDGKKLLEGGGSIVYGSNHKEVYAPGGLGVLSGSDDGSDILFYHYLNTTTGVRHKDAQLGWNYLDYVDGWPVPSDKRPQQHQVNNEPDPEPEPEPEPTDPSTHREPKSSDTRLLPRYMAPVLANMCTCILLGALAHKGLIRRRWIVIVPIACLVAWFLAVSGVRF